MTRLTQMTPLTRMKRLTQMNRPTRTNRRTPTNQMTRTDRPTRRCLALLLGLLAVSGIACDDDETEAPPDDAPPSVQEIDGGPDGADAPGNAGQPADSPTTAPDDTAAVTETDGASATRTETVYSVQVGAFTRAENADALQDRLENAGLPVWTSTAQVSGQSYTRVRVGGAETVADARSVMARVRDSFAGAAWIAPVPPDETLPDGVLEATGRLVGGG